MIRFFHRAEEILLCFLLALLTLQVFFEAILRTLGYGFLWLEESVSWNAAWFVLLGASYGVRTGSHIGLTVLTDRIAHPMGKKILSLIATAICISYCVIFLYSAWDYVYKQYKIGFELDDIPLPMWVPYSGLLLGFLLLLLRFFAVFINIITNRSSGLTYVDEAKESLEQFANTNQKEHQL